MLALSPLLLLLATSAPTSSPTTGLAGRWAALAAAADASVRGEAAPRLSPRATEPAWFVTYQPLMAEIDAAKVSYILGTRDAFYLEAKRRWLCFRTEVGAESRCFEWPARAPRMTAVDVLRGRDERLDRLFMRAGELTIEARIGRAARGWRPTIARVRREPDMDDASLPPSRRPAPRAPRADATTAALEGLLLPPADDLPPALARAMTALPHDEVAARLSSIEHAGTSLVTVAEIVDPAAGIDRAWSCHRPAGGRRSCGETNIAQARALAPERTLPHGWLLHVSDAGQRWASLSLVWVAPGPGGLASATLDLGGAQGNGEDCRFTDSYCVWMEGTFTPYEVVAPDCVRVGSTLLWSALHVRVTDRWLHEKRWAAPTDHEPRPGTYRPAAGEWVPATCTPDLPERR
jgi:hypothetical protein